MKKKSLKALQLEKETIAILKTIKGGGDDPWISLASRSAICCDRTRGCGSHLC